MGSDDGGVPLAENDPQCVYAWSSTESPRPRRCGLGAELVFAFGALGAGWRRLRN